MNILLCCAAGMSTSLLVQRMEEAAREKGLEGRIWAVSADEVMNNLDQAQVLLLGPQVRYKLAELKKEGEARGIPVDVISPLDYGTLNGKNVLEFALRLKRN
ncbi:MAG: PTS sugar transporter subunit IIB [Brevibacillus sp.]|nr:PTS sugar transporter subunit IIB [Brevibacillus sp.]